MTLLLKSTFFNSHKIFLRPGVCNLDHINSIKSTKQLYSSHKPHIILGIETSCDDTGCAVVNSDGILLGDALHSQHLIHIRNGGIIPPVAQDLHRKYMEPVVNEAMAAAGLSFDEIDAIAVTTKPGLPLSLTIGVKYAKHLARKYSKPILPIHHMEAHALMARMEKNIQFPFLVLLISGGHSLLAVARDVDEFYLLGDSLHNSPGETYDKVARRAKLRNIPIFSKLSGGQAIELAATMSENPGSFTMPNTLMDYRDCNFSYAGMKAQAIKFIEKSEKKHDIEGDGIIPEIYDFCFGFQLAVTTHLCQRTQRAIEYAEMTELIPNNNRVLVVSGGVACNNFITKGLDIVCKSFGYQLIRPRPKLCTDNGIMIAWNGMERFRRNIGIVNDTKSIQIDTKCKFGINKMHDVTNMNIKCKWVKLKELLEMKNSQNEKIEHSAT